MKNTILGLVILACLGVGCKDKTEERDASGMFETREVIVSSEMSGRVERLEVMEGDYIEAGKVVGLIDTMQLHWLKVQAQQAVKVSLLISHNPNSPYEIEIELFLFPSDSSKGAKTCQNSLS